MLSVGCVWGAWWRSRFDQIFWWAGNGLCILLALQVSEWVRTWVSKWESERERLRERERERVSGRGVPNIMTLSVMIIARHLLSSEIVITMLVISLIVVMQCNILLFCILSFSLFFSLSLSMSMPLCLSLSFSLSLSKINSYQLQTWIHSLSTFLFPLIHSVFSHSCLLTYAFLSGFQSPRLRQHRLISLPLTVSTN